MIEKYFIAFIPFLLSVGFNLYQLHVKKKNENIIGTSFNHSWHELIAMKETCELFWKNHKNNSCSDALSAAKAHIDTFYRHSSRLADSIERDSRNLKLGHPGEK